MIGETKTVKICPKCGKPMQADEDVLFHEVCTCLPEPAPPLQGKRPFRCPICNGNMLVPNGFYNQTSGDWATNSLDPEKCRSCKDGIVWSDDNH